MNQQINLFQPEAEIKDAFFPVSMVAQFCLVAILIFIGFTVNEYKKLETYKSQLVNLKINAVIPGEPENSIASNGQIDDEISQINKEIENLTSQLTQREQISNALTLKTSNNVSGFSHYLEALAKGHVEDTWLTYINIRQGGVLIRLEGKAMSSELVPYYVNNISNQQELNNVKLDVIELAHAENNSDESVSIMNFLVGTN